MNTSADARVIASFTFIVVLMIGAWGHLEHLLTQTDFFLMSEPEIARFGIALLPFAAAAVAFQAEKAVEAAWAHALGGAAVMLGILSGLGGILFFLSRW